MDDDKITIDFTPADIDLIREYMALVDVTSLHNAVMNAVSIALDDE